MRARACCWLFVLRNADPATATVCAATAPPGSPEAVSVKLQDAQAASLSEKTAPPRPDGADVRRKDVRVALAEAEAHTAPPLPAALLVRLNTTPLMRAVAARIAPPQPCDSRMHTARQGRMNSADSIRAQRLGSRASCCASHKTLRHQL